MKKHAVHCWNNEQRAVSGMGSDIITACNTIISSCPRESRQHLRHLTKGNANKGKMNKSKHDSFNAYLVRGAGFDGKWEIPIIEDVPQIVPEEIILFTEMKKSHNHDAWVHFYTDDRRFNCIWNSPTKYLAQFKRFQGVISPDFSVYRDMPLSVQLYAVYRSRAVGFWLTTQGVPVIPNVRWGDERSYEFCFHGVIPNSTVAVGTNGCLQDPTDRALFRQGLDEMCHRLNPKTILVYGPTPEEMFKKHKDAGIKVVEYTAEMRRVHEAKLKEGEQ